LPALLGFAGEKVLRKATVRRGRVRAKFHGHQA